MREQQMLVQHMRGVHRDDGDDAGQLPEQLHLLGHERRHLPGQLDQVVLREQPVPEQRLHERLVRGSDHDELMPDELHLLGRDQRRVPGCRHLAVRAQQPVPEQRLPLDRLLPVSGGLALHVGARSDIFSEEVFQMAARTLAIALITMGTLLGCGREPDAGEGASSKSAPPADTSHAQEAVVLHARLDEPAGWAKVARGRWQVFASPDGLSRFALATLGAAEAPVALVTDDAPSLGVSDVHLAGEQDTPFGAEQLPARAADGSCRFGAAEGRIGYAVIDIGGGKRVIVIHAAHMDLPQETQRVALTAIRSLRRP